MIKVVIKGICTTAILATWGGGIFVVQADTLEKLKDDELEKIVVTANKRNVGFIDSDSSVTVLGINDIQEARLRDFTRIDDLVPNVQISTDGQHGNIFITVRGVESNPFIVNRAAVYIDGIPFRELSNAVLNQIDSIEVLRGPQATLYGANTESGLILVQTKKPTEISEGNMRLTATNFASGNGIEADGAISGPLLPTLTGSLAFSLTNEEAYLKNLGSSTGETGKFNEQYLQGRLHWTPNDNLTVNAITYWLDMDAPGIFGQQYVPLNINLYNELYSNDFNDENQLGKWTYFEDAPKYKTEKEIVAGLSSIYQLSFGAIEMAVSMRKVKSVHKGLDFDLTATPIVAGQEVSDKKFSNIETRFISEKSDTFDYILGASYYYGVDDNTKATFLGIGTIDSYISAPTQREISKDVGLFGSTNLYITSKLKMTAGLRYDRAKRSTVQNTGELDLGYGSVVVYPDANLTKTFDILLPRLAFHYGLTDDFSLHASVARGYIPGGFNLVAVQQGVVDNDVISYDSETLLSREIGFKWRSSDRTMRLSGAVFYINSDNWQEIQIAYDERSRPISSDYISSDAAIRNIGAEVEGHWQVSDELSFDGHIGYVNAKYRDLQLDETLNVRGQPIQFVPEYDGGLSIRYQASTGFYIRGEAGFTGKAALRSRGDIFQGAVTTYGLQLGYEASDYAVRLFGDNLTNERIANGLAIENLAFGTDGLYYAPLNSPRVIGLEAEAWF